MNVFLLNIFQCVIDNKEPTFFEAICDVIIKNRFLIYTWLCLIPLAYLFELLKYYFRNVFYINDDTINLGQITVKGELSKILDHEQIALMLRSEFASIQQCLDTIGSEKLNSCPAQAASIDYYFFFSGIKEKSDKNGTVIHQNTVIPVIKGLVNKPRIQANITLGFKSIKIPVSEIFRTIIQIIGLIPVPTRNKYNKSLIHISLINQEKHAKAVVYRYGSSKRKGFDNSNNNYSLTCSAPFNTIDEINDLLRNVAFMVLKLHNDKTFQDTEWKSMRYLMDGFTEFSCYRNSGLVKDRNNAKELFIKALAEDSEHNIEAMYYLAVMLMVERTTTSIEKAINYFNNALRTEDPKFKSFVNLGLSFCYSQSFHRLGKTNKDMIEKADEALRNVKKFWEKKIEQDRLHQKDIDKEEKKLPLLPYMNGMIGFVKAGAIKRNTKKKKDILLGALKFSLVASKLDSYNSIFKNNVGWALMQLAISKVTEIPSGYIPNEKERETALLAEHYFLDALALNPGNKLTHANLALLYSIPYFRKNKDGNELSFLKSRFHGLKAIKLDTDYINAYRDLCITYLRFKKFELAEEYFYKALEIAESPVKDAELFTGLIKEAKKNGAPEELLKKWSKPKSELFEPH